MKRRLTLILIGVVVLSFGLMAQNRVIIGERREPNPDARLEIVNPDAKAPGGLLLPYVKLQRTDNPAPLTGGSTEVGSHAHLRGMMVYNTATSEAGVADDKKVTPGIYFNDGSQWLRASTGVEKCFWRLGGNAGTDPAKHFLGTTDDKDLVLKRNNLSKVQIAATGVGINKAAPEATLHVGGSVKIENVPAARASDLVLRYNTDTKEVTAAPKTSDTKLFYRLEYIIRTGKEDWVKNWDTEIDAKDYTLIITNADFGSTLGDDVPVFIANKGGSAPQRVFAWINPSTDTWRINADFVATHPTTTGESAWAWHISVLVVNNTLIRNLGLAWGEADQEDGSGHVISNPVPRLSP